jgi:hypothetical protein
LENAVEIRWCPKIRDEANRARLIPMSGAVLHRIELRADIRRRGDSIPCRSVHRHWRQSVSRSCPDCEGLKEGSHSLEDPHEYLVPTGRSKAGGAVFYRCLLCNTFLTYAPDESASRWNPGFRPHSAPGQPMAN